MKASLPHPDSARSPRLIRHALATGLLLLLGLPFARAIEVIEADVTTVFATVPNGYIREKLPDGSLKPVRYAFGEGTCDPGSVADLSLAKLKFDQLAVLLSAPLARQGYEPCHEVDNIEQLIVIHWGRTVGWHSDGYGDGYGNLDLAHAAMKSTFPTLSPDMGNFGPGQREPPTRGLGGTPGAASEMDAMFTMLQQQEEARQRANDRNARLLGYFDTLSHIPTFQGNLVSSRREQLLWELEDDRYYVIVTAYDFQSTRKNRQPKILWITRLSLQTRGNDFDRSVPGMIRAASAYLGTPSDGLRRERLPEGRASLGELKVLDYEEPAK